MYHCFYNFSNTNTYVSWAANDNDFWRSCDTEDWSNDVGNTALVIQINKIWQCIHIDNIKLLIEIIFDNISLVNVSDFWTVVFVYYCF